MPDADRAPVRVLGANLTAFLFALLCRPDYIAFAVPGLPWVTAIRLFDAPMMLIMVYSVATSSQFRARMMDLLSAAPDIWKLFVTFTVIALLSIALSSNIPVSVNKFVVAQMSWTTVFFAACYVFVEPSRVRRLVAYLLGILIYCSAIGVYEIKYEKLPWAGRMPFLKIKDEQVLRVLAAVAGGERYQSRAE